MALKKKLIPKSKQPVVSRKQTPAKKNVSWMGRGYNKAQEMKPKFGADAEIRFGGKKGFKAEDKLFIVFQEPDSNIQPICYYAHNMFSINKIGFLTCAQPDPCKLCDKKIETVFKAAWGIWLIGVNNIGGDVQSRYFCRGTTELGVIQGIAESVAERCSECGKRMKNLGGTFKCTLHPKAPPSTISDWIFSLYKTGENTSTRWNFDREELVDDDLRRQLKLVPKFALEKAIQPKPEKYIDKVIADMDLDETDFVPGEADKGEETFFED